MADRNAWKGDAAAPATGGAPRPSKPNDRSKRVFMLAAGFVGLLGVIAALIVLIQPPPSPYFVPICITEYKSRHYPVNALAQQDREALLRADGPFSNKSTNAFSSQEKQLLVEELKNLARRSEPVVVYLSAFMIADASGELMLLPADARPDEPSTWLRFTDVLQDLKASPSKHKLLIIDTMRPIADHRIGVLANDIATRAKTAVDQVPDPNLFILCSCSPGQTASAADVMRQSVFGFYVDEGLRGWADGYNTEQKTDGRVSVQELSRFVKARVDRWTQKNQNGRQTPVLWGDAEDFNLAVLPQGEPIAPRQLAAPEEYPPWLTAGWGRRDQWWADGSFRLTPHLFRELEATVLHAEQQWRGGVESARVQADLQKQLDSLQSQLAQAKRAVPRPEPKSLMLALRHRPPPPPAPEPSKDEKEKEKAPPPTVKEMRQLLTKLDEVGRGLKPDEAAAARLKLTEEFTARFKTLPTIDQAQQVFEVLADDTFPSADKVTYLYGFLRQTQPLPLYVETLFLRRLDELATQKTTRPWPTEVVRRALTVLREGEKANACDARIFPWVRAALTRAAQERHDAEILLFARGSASMEEADRLFQEAARQYQAINGSIEILETAARIHDEAVAILPAAVPYLLARPEEDERDRQSWAGALEMVQAVDGFFAAPPDTLTAGDLQKRIGELQQNADTLRLHIGNLTRAFTADLPRLLALARKIDFADPSVVQQIELALETPWPTAKERVELYNAGRTLARKFHEATRALDDQENTRRRVTELLPDFDRARAQKEEQERAARRARVVVDFLGMGAFPTDGLTKDLEQARQAQRWPSLAQELRRTWAEQVPRQLGELSELPAQARLARVVAAFDRVPLLADAATNPSVQLQRSRNGALLGWLGDRYRYTRRDLPGLAEGRDRLVHDFYDEAARVYLQDAVEPPAETYLQFGPPADSLDFRSEKQAASTRLPLRQFGPPGAATAPKVVRPFGISADWLQVAIPDLKLAGAGPWDVPLDIQFRSSGGGSDPNPAEGFLVQADLGDRHYHTRVSLQAPIPDSQRLQILVSDSPKEPEISLAELRLRPNQRQSVHLFVRNPSDTARKVQIELKAEGAPTTLSEPLDVGAKETKKVVLGKPMPAPPEGKKPELPELSGSLQLRLIEADKKAVLDEKRLRVSIAQPREYIRVSNIRYEPGEKNKLIVQVRPAGRIEGPPCRVRLELPRERMPGFVKAESGTFEGQLQGDAEVTLSAETLMFEDAADENGYVYLTVDGYERAFIFRITFARRGTGVAPQEVLRPELRIQAPRYLAPGQACPVKIETDNSQAGANLDISIDRNPGNFTVERQLQGDRRQQVYFAPVGPEGTLFFETAVSDWSVVLDLGGIKGTRDIRGRMLDSRGGEITKAIQPVTVDPTPPVGLRVVKVAKAENPNPAVPIKVYPHALMPVTVEGIDPESGVEKVRFYLAKPVDGKMPPGTPSKDGRPLNGDKTIWIGEVPADKEGATDLTVELVNRVGLTTLSPTYALHVTKGDGGDPNDKKDKPGSIVGTVLEGDRPQPGLTVELTEPKAAAPGDKPKTAKTDENGKFEFKDLEPGAYKVKSSKPVSNRKGEETVIVSPGKAASVTIKLLQ